MGKTIVCASCGAGFDDEQVKCPYCGSTNIKGVEKDYMEKLEDVRETMESLDDVPVEELQKVVKKQSRRIRIVMILVVAIALLVIAIYLISGYVDKRDYRNQYLWRQEHYPQMDTLYNEGKYDELADLVYYELINDKDCVLYEWEHYQFIDTYELLRSLSKDLDFYSGRELKDYELQWIFYSEWRVKEAIYSKDKYSPEEYEALLPFIEKAEADFNARWNMSQEDYDRLYGYLTNPDQGYVPLNITDEYVKEWLKEN